MSVSAASYRRCAIVGWHRGFTGEIGQDCSERSSEQTCVRQRYRRFWSRWVREKIMKNIQLFQAEPKRGPTTPVSAMECRGGSCKWRKDPPRRVEFSLSDVVMFCVERDKGLILSVLLLWWVDRDICMIHSRYLRGRKREREGRERERKRR